MAPLPIMVRTTRRERFMVRPGARFKCWIVAQHLDMRLGAGQAKAECLTGSCAKVSSVLSRRRKNAPQRPGQNRRSRRVPSLSTQVRSKTANWWCRRRNCSATTIRPSRRGPHWKNIPATGIRRPVVATTALPFRRPSVRNSRAASAHRRHPRSQACPSGEVPHAWSA